MESILQVKNPKKHDKNYLVNRDIDWLSFNSRVLSEAENRGVPIYERLKFMAIFSSNLDEFFRVRVSKLRQIKAVDKSLRKPLGLKPNKTLKQLLALVNEQQERLGKLYENSILPELRSNGVDIIDGNILDEGQKKFLRQFFLDNAMNKMKIIEGRKATSNSFEDGELYLATMVDGHFFFVSVPVNELGRFIEIPMSLTGHAYMFLEDIIALFLNLLFANRTIGPAYSIKISKDAELYLEDEYYGNWVVKINDYLLRRQAGQPTRLLYQGNMPDDMVTQLKKLLGIGKVDMIRGGSHHNFSDFFDFPVPQNSEGLFYEPMPPLSHSDFEGVSDYFALISKKDRIIHFPYQRFDYLEQWLLQAALDENVHRIQISLYRIAKNSALTTALLNALENGKEVLIFVEAKARFDEENNIVWGKVFEKHGAKVQYSFPNVKVHSKILLIERNEEGRNRLYAYIGTGNFNAKTAKLYCDHGLFTADEQITQDLAQVFHVLQRKVILPLHKELLVSPFSSRLTFEHLIQQEIENAQNGLPSGITMKMNSLEDKDMIAWLYKAGQAGVPIKILVRGICCLVPDLTGLSKSIQVTSIIDRFLEHGRLFLFHNKGDEKMFMGSADWMTRNLDRRIEVIVPIKDKDIFEELRHLLSLQLSDNVKARVRHPERDNAMAHSEGLAIRSQYAIYDYLETVKSAIGKD